MQRTIVLAILAVMIVPLGPVPGQPPGLPRFPGRPRVSEMEARYYALLDGWFERYLRRRLTPSPTVSGWVRALETGTTQEAMAAQIIASPEYYTNAGGDNRRFVARLIADVTGRPATPREMNYLLNRLYQGEDRTHVIYAFLTLHPEGLQVAAPPAQPSYEYRRPYHRDDDHDRRDHRRDDRRDRRDDRRDDRDR